jgi:hypothetical protein
MEAPACCEYGSVWCCKLPVDTARLAAEASSVAVGAGLVVKGCMCSRRLQPPPPALCTVNQYKEPTARIKQMRQLFALFVAVFTRLLPLQWTRVWCIACMVHSTVRALRELPCGVVCQLCRS